MASSSTALRGLLVSLFVLGFAVQLEAQSTCTTSIYDAVNATDSLSLLKVVIDAAGLRETLSNKDLKVTVAAPNNDAFQALLKVLNDSGLTLGDVTAPESNKAASILLYHVIPVPALSTDLSNGEVLPTLLGSGYNLTVDLSSGVKFIAAKNAATVVTPDVQVCDSVVHIIDTVMIPADLADIPNYMPASPSPTPETPPPTGSTVNPPAYYPPTPSPPPEPLPGSAGKTFGGAAALGVAVAVATFLFALA